MAGRMIPYQQLGLIQAIGCSFSCAAGSVFEGIRPPALSYGKGTLITRDKIWKVGEILIKRCTGGE